jgi:hypothetical protein
MSMTFVEVVAILDARYRAAAGQVGDIRPGIQ